MKSRQFALSLLLVFVLSNITGCEKESVKIGFMADLTGRASGLGTSARNGASMAVDIVNQSGGIAGRELELVICDDEGIPEVAVKKDEELISKGITAGIGHMTSGPGIAGLEVFEKADILMISPLMSADSLSGKDDDFLRIIGSNRYQGEILARTAVEFNPEGKLAIIYEYNNRNYAKDIITCFKDIYTQNGGEICHEGSFVSAPDLDYETESDKIIESGAEGVLIISGGVDLGLYVQTIKAKKPEMIIYSGMWGMTNDSIEKGGRAIEGTYFVGVYDKMNKNPEFIEFRNSYFARYNEEPTFASVYSYETVLLLSAALKKAANLSTDEIKRCLLNTGVFKGLQDSFTLDEFGDSSREYFLFKVEDAEFVRVR